MTAAVVAVLSLACSSIAGEDGSMAASTGGGGGNMTTVTACTTSIATSAGSGGAMPFACDPPAARGSIYELEAVPFNPPFDPLSMCHYRGQVMLAVNTAAL